ncbi:MAG: BatD family protein, partial [Planctomycetota bacterium]
MIIRPLLLLSLLASVFCAEAHLEVPASMRPGTTAAVTLIVSDASEPLQSIDFPRDLNGLTWHTTSLRQSSETTIVNGQRSSRRIVRTFITAEQAGTYRIPAFAVVLRDGSALSTRAVDLVVSGEPLPVIDGAGEARVTISPSTIVPGQDAVVTYSVVLNGEQRSIDRLGLQLPNELIGRGEWQQDEVESLLDQRGQAWKLYRFQHTVTASTPGSYRFSGQQTTLTQRSDGFFARQTTGPTLPIMPATLTVSPLPEAGRPADWSGVVGAISLTATLDRPRITLGESAELTITVHGERAEQLVTPPQPSVNGAQIYPADNDSSDDNSRSWRWTVVPISAGTVTIAAVRVPWFDPASHSYQTARSGSLELTVLPGRDRQVRVAGSNADGTSATDVTPGNEQPTL